jgi:hypothetical protein
MGTGVVRNLESLMASARLEERVAALEAAVAPVNSKLEERDTITSRWEQIAGTFQNDPICERAMRLGQQYRQSLRPKSPTQRNKSLDDAVSCPSTPLRHAAPSPDASETGVPAGT